MLWPKSAKGMSLKFFKYLSKNKYKSSRFLIGFSKKSIPLQGRSKKQMSQLLGKYSQNLK